MALEKQNISISFSGGIDTKTDSKQVMAGKLLTLENGIFISPKKIKKRNGYDKLSNTILGLTAPISNGQGITSYLEELVLFDKTSLYSYNKGLNDWVKKGALLSTNIDQFPVVRNTYQQTAQDSAFHPSGVYVFAWEDSSGGVRYSIIDSATEQNIVHDALISATAFKPKVLAFGNYVMIIYLDATNHLFALPIPVNTPNVPLTVITLATNVNATSLNYDAEIIGSKIYLAFDNTTGGGAISLKYLDSSLTVSAEVAITGEAATGCITVFEDGANQDIIVAYYNGTKVRYLARSSNLSVQNKAPTDIETIANVINISGHNFDSTAGDANIYYTIKSSPFLRINYLVKTCQLTAFVAGSPSVFIRSCGLAGKVFLYNSINYIPITYDSDQQPTYFISDQNKNIAAKILPSLGGGVSAKSILPEVSVVNSTTFQIALLRKDLLTTVSGSIFTQTGVEAVNINFFDQQKSYLRAELGENLHISGGVMTMYDGVTPVEHGFHLYPEGVTAAQVTTTGFIAPGTYDYSICYEWTDNKGQTHRSAPSIPLSVVVPSGTSTNKVTLTIPTLRITAKQNARTPVLLVVYRTEANGTIFYQLTSVTAPLVNDITVDTVTYADTANDTSIVGNPLLYTTGSVIENISAPASASMTTYKNRIVIAPSDNPLTVWYSKQVIPGSPVEFSDLLTINIDSFGGDITAISNLDDKMIAFKKTSIFYLTGAGPDSTGAQNDFSDFQLVTSDSGCINPRSIVLTPNGIMYQSAKGIYLLDRSLQVSYKGADVEAYNSSNVLSARLIPYTNQIRFCMDSGVVLVYDYFVDQWAVFTNIPGIDATVYNNLFVYIRSNGSVYLENPLSFTDAGNFIKLKIITSWLSVAGLQGFQRIHRALILGEYISPHLLQAQIAYDYNPNPIQQSYVDAKTLLPVSAYGEDPFYGSGQFYGIDNVIGEYPLYQWRIHLAKQKCQAIQLWLEDNQNTNYGEGLSLSGITLEVSIKRGAFKTSAIRSVG